MRIGLIDVDGHRYPNLPLMKISAWHKRNGDQVEWYDPLLSGHMDKVYMSKVFSFTPDYGWPVDADQVQKGGSGYCISIENGREMYHREKDISLPDDVEHICPDWSIYPEYCTDTAYGFLTRGCPRACSFCHVAAKEGRCSRKVADLDEFWSGQKNIVLNDPNILACRDHMELLMQLRDSGANVELNQGLDIRLMNEDNIAILKDIRLNHIHFAYDKYQDKDTIEPKMRMVQEMTGWGRNKKGPTVFILCNYDTTIDQDIERIQFCRGLGWTPYPMIYDKANADPIYRKLQRWCNNYIFWVVPTFEEYTRKSDYISIGEYYGQEH